MLRVDYVVIGAGVIGLACAKYLAEQGAEVLVIEREACFGHVTSSRNSGVIHAGIYYAKDSLKAQTCVAGNRALYEYCQTHHVPHRKTGKYIVATSARQEAALDSIADKAHNNGVEGIMMHTGQQVARRAPGVACLSALWVPSTGIIDAAALMRAYIADFEAAGGMIGYHSSFEGATRTADGFILNIQADEMLSIHCRGLINTAGLFAADAARLIEGVRPESIPQMYFAKGNYFETTQRLNIPHLIYPVPEGFGLGVHLTLDLSGALRFGPDVQWCDSPWDYAVDPARKTLFAEAIKSYLPDLDTTCLVPGYSGMRPILNKKEKGMQDFVIQTAKTHQVPGLLNIYGVESPGLTASLPLGQRIAECALSETTHLA